MRLSFVIVIMMFFGNVATFAQTVKDVNQVEETVKQFVKAADHQDAAQLEKLLHSSFRAVINRQFGSEEVSLMDKTLYVQLVKDKKIGGDTRTTNVLSMDIEGNNAFVKVLLEGKQLRFITTICLVKTAKGNWELVQDMPIIEKV